MEISRRFVYLASLLIIHIVIYTDTIRKLYTGNMNGNMLEILFVYHLMQKSRGIHGNIVLISNTSMDNNKNRFSGVLARILHQNKYNNRMWCSTE
jgi:hypothetical protein